MRIERDQIITVAVLLGLGLAFVLVVWLPQQRREARLELDLLAARSDLSSQRQQVEGLAQLSAQVREAQAKLDEQPKRLPQESELASLLRQLGGEMEERRVADQAIQTLVMQSGDDFSVIPVRLAFRGSFFDVFGIVANIEHMDRLVHIGKLTVSGASNNERDQRLSVTVDLHPFFATGSGGKS